MALTNLFYYEQQWQLSDPNQLTIVFEITAAETVSSVPLGAPVLPTFAALTQQTINSFLGTTNEFLAAQFDSTSMGTNAFGVIVNMGGQAYGATHAEIALYPTAAVITEAGGNLSSQIAAVQAGTLSSSALAANIQFEVGAFGNMAVKTVLPGIDALTSGLIVLKLYWISQ